MQVRLQWYIELGEVERGGKREQKILITHVYSNSTRLAILSCQVS